MRDLRLIAGGVLLVVMMFLAASTAVNNVVLPIVAGDRSPRVMAGASLIVLVLLAIITGMGLSIVHARQKRQAEVRTILRGAGITHPLALDLAMHRIEKQEREIGVQASDEVLYRAAGWWLPVNLALESVDGPHKLEPPSPPQPSEPPMQKRCCR